MSKDVYVIYLLSDSVHNLNEHSYMGYWAGRAKMKGNIMCPCTTPIRTRDTVLYLSLKRAQQELRFMIDNYESVIDGLVIKVA